jgi:hypothetical protein
MTRTKHFKFSASNRAGETLSRQRFLKLLAALTVIVAFSCATLTGCDSRPSDDEVKSCIFQATAGIQPVKIDFGKTITSQGGMLEMAIGAPNGTKIFSTKASFNPSVLSQVPYERAYWVFKDSFGKVQCVRQ